MCSADVTTNIPVKPLAALIASYLMMECDRGAQRSFFRTAEFDSFGEKQCCPLFMNGVGLV